LSSNPVDTSLAVLKSLLSSAYEAAAYHQSQIKLWMIHWSINNSRVDPGADKLMVVGSKAMIPYDTDERRKYLTSISKKGLAYYNTKYRE
jgi:hypothetical protein